MDTNKKRIDYFDIAKGIAILAVIWGHCWGISQSTINFIFSFHMPIFFFISGYFFRERSTKENILLKAKQLLIPYVVTGTAILGLTTIRLVLKKEFIDTVYRNALDIIWAIFYGCGHDNEKAVYIYNVGALWFFCALFFGFILLNECIKSKYSLFWVIGIASLGYYTSKILWVPLSVQAAMTCLVYMYAGYLAHKYEILQYLNNKWIVLELFVIYIFYYLWGGGQLYLVRNWFGQGVWEIVGSFCAVLCVIKISQIISERIKPLKYTLIFLGKNTQIILCFHIIEIFVVDWSFIYDLFWQYGAIVTVAVLFIVRTIFSVIGMLLFHSIWKKVKKASPTRCIVTPKKIARERDTSIDLARGIAILLMVYAHYPIDQTISKVIFSFHMPVFIIISGYFYNKEEKVRDTVRKTVKSLFIPYLGAALGYAAISVWKYIFYTDISVVSGREALCIFMEKLSYIPWGISYASTKFQEIESVGPIWFILCLVLVRILYSILNKICRGDKYLTAAVGICCIAGCFIGKYIAYLPWSADVAMVSLIFFHLGYWIRKKCVLEKNMDPAVGILLFLLWALDVHYGSLDLAARAYTYFPLCIIGAAAGSVLFLKCCKVVKMPETIYRFLCFCGRNSMVILCIHCLEQRNCYWQGILPDASANIVFVIRIMIILSFTVIVLAVKEGLKHTVAGWKRAKIMDHNTLQESSSF